MEEDMAWPGWVGVLLLVVAVAGCGDRVGSASNPEEKAQEAPRQGVSLSAVDGPPLLTLGENEDFGSIDGLEVVGPERFALLDGMRRQVLLFSLNGLLLDSIGRQGEGPGEFFSPVALAKDPQGNLVVVDRSAMRLVEFSVDGDSLAFLRNVRTEIVPSDYCAIGERRIVLGLHEGHLLHEVDDEGGILSSFAPVEGDSFEQRLRSIAKMDCSASPGRIAVSPLSIGILEIYGTDGRLIARDSVPDHVAVIYHRDGNSIRPERPPEGFIHETASVTWFADTVLLQFNRPPVREDLDTDGRMFVVGTHTWIPSRRPSLPRILAVTEDLLFLTASDPIPSIYVFRSGQ
jgi:hypothetical protein